MRTSAELKELNENIGKAIFAYCNAIEENLKESGEEHDIIEEWDD